jgi:hypothetical protein
MISPFKKLIDSLQPKQVGVNASFMTFTDLSKHDKRFKNIKKLYIKKINNYRHSNFYISLAPYDPDPIINLIFHIVSLKLSRLLNRMKFPMQFKLLFFYDNLPGTYLNDKKFLYFNYSINYNSVWINTVISRHYAIGLKDRLSIKLFADCVCLTGIINYCNYFNKSNYAFFNNLIIETQNNFTMRRNLVNKRKNLWFF